MDKGPSVDDLGNNRVRFHSGFAHVRLVATAAFFVAIGVGVAMMANYLISTYHFDNRKPYLNLVQIPLQSRVQYGKPYVYRATYDKRGDCRGISGYYRAEGTTNGGEVVDVKFRKRAKGTWAVGKKRVATVTVSLPPSMLPGKYDMWWTWTYKCERASKVLEVISPRLSVVVY